MTYVWVECADDTAAQARAAGGTIVAEPFDSLDGGRMAVIADPAGGVFAAWELGEHRGAQLVNEPGAWSMSMLSTPDTETAAAFYAEVFGWSTDSFGEFTMFRLEGYVGGEPTQPVPRDVIAVMAPGEQAGVDARLLGRRRRRGGRAGRRARRPGRDGAVRHAGRPHRRARRPGRRGLLGQQGGTSGLGPIARTGIAAQRRP